MAQTTGGASKGETMREPNEITVKAIALLKERGPMTGKQLATELGLANARSLSMWLQWQAQRGVFNEHGKWRVR
jgi:predicted transcriptional regulator